MKKKFTLLIAVLLAGVGFSATAAVGDVFTASGYNFKVVAEGDVNEVEFAPKASGFYNVTSTSAFSSLNTVANDGITYTIVGVGEYAFQDAQFPSNGNTNMPANIRYISDYAFKGVKSGGSESRGSIRFYGNALRYMSSKAFLDNNLQGSILITSGDAENGFVQINSLVTSRYSTDANMYLAAEHGTKYIAFPQSYPAGTSNGWSPAYKVKIGAEIKTIGAYAMMNCTNYSQIDLGSVEVIDTAAFKNTALTTITLPATITHVAADAFEGNTSLTRVTVNCGYDAVKDMVFDDAVYNRIRESGSITVPAAELETFQNDPNWYKFWSETPPAPPVTRVHIADAENGEVTADNLNPADGATVTLTVTPEAGYKLQNIKVEAVIDPGNAQAPRRIEGPGVGLNVELTTVTEGQTYTFVMPDAPYEVLVTSEFAIAEYTITVADGIEHGTVTAPATAHAGDNVSLTVTPAEGYELETLTYTVEGAEPVAIENNAFQMPAANVTINATFKAIDYTITVAEMQNGTVTAPATAHFGDNVTLTVTPAEGYELQSLTYTVEGAEPVAIENNAFTMPAANVTINATFKAIEYTITVADMQNGTVEAPATAHFGDNVSMTVTPAEGYELETLTYTVEGAEPVAIENNAFQMPAANVTINATFKAIDYTITVAEMQNGTVTAPATAHFGDNVTLTVTPAEGYELQSLTYTVEGAEPVAIENNAFTMPAANVTINATFSLIPVVLDGVVFATNVYATWYGNQNLAVPENVTAYVVTSIEDDVTLIEEVNYLPAGVGVLLYSTTPADVVTTVPYFGETAEVTSLLQGYLEDTAINNGYVLFDDAFVLADDGTLAAHRCYLPMPAGGNGAPRLRIVLGSEVVTAIADVRAAADGTVRYIDVNGRVSDKPFQGINIVVNADGTVSKMVK